MPSSIAALHLVGVGDGVDRPHVVGVGGDGGQPGVQRLAVVPGLLEPERGHAAHERGVRVGGVELAQRARPGGRGGLRRRRVKKSSWCPNISASRSVGQRDEQVVEARARRRPSRPPTHAPMAPAWACSRSLPAGGHQRLAGLAGRREVGRVGAHQVEVGDQGVGHRRRRRRRRPARWRGRRRRGGTARGGRWPGRTARRSSASPDIGLPWWSSARVRVMWVAPFG